MIETLMAYGATKDLEETVGNILSVAVLGNMKIILKKDEFIKKKVVLQIEVQKEVYKVTCTSVLMPTKTGSGATSKTPQKITPDLTTSIKKKKLRKMKDEGSSEFGVSLVPKEVTTHALETIVEECQVASNVVEIFLTGNPLNFVSDNVLNSSISPLLTKLATPTPPQSRSQSSEHAPSPKLD
ncbi:unnamed protein product [Vicia faba]|uniref:Uncharacterized protein n=1 Tax=Vicia faba TaxID=3906 RepID=A0AAV0ZVF8_VICFA|nr:unnamed protein product [Vicia faba]